MYIRMYICSYVYSLTITHVYVFLIYSDNGSNKDFPGMLGAFGEEAFKSGTGTFHPPPDADAQSIKSGILCEDLSFQPLHPPDTYDKLSPRKVR